MVRKVFCMFTYIYTTNHLTSDFGPKARRVRGLYKCVENSFLYYFGCKDKVRN